MVSFLVERYPNHYKPHPRLQTPPTSMQCFIQKYPPQCSQFWEHTMYNSLSNSFFCTLPLKVSKNWFLVGMWEQRRPHRNAGSSLTVSSVELRGSFLDGEGRRWRGRGGGGEEGKKGESWSGGENRRKGRGGGEEERRKEGGVWTRGGEAKNVKLFFRSRMRPSLCEYTHY